MAQLLGPFAGDSAHELAKQLRDRFGSLSQALAAPASQLRKVGEPFSEACNLLLAARNLVAAAQQEILSSEPVDPRNPKLLTYLRERLCRAREERLLVVFCDSDQRYVHDEEMGWGSAHQVRLDASHLFKRALELDSSRLLLAHNHPSGECSPSPDDIDSTRRLASTAQVLGIEIVDHLIVTKSNAYSMRAGGRM